MARRLPDWFYVAFAYVVTAVGGEADRLWPMVLAMYPGYADYQARTKRAIPLFVLEPA
jgi:hypothetical protein